MPVTQQQMDTAISILSRYMHENEQAGGMSLRCLVKVTPMPAPLVDALQHLPPPPGEILEMRVIATFDPTIADELEAVMQRHMGVPFQSERDETAGN